LYGKLELGSGFDYYLFFANEVRGLILNYIVNMLCSRFGIGIFADNDSFIQYILAMVVMHYSVLILRKTYLQDLLMVFLKI
jgi:hypothetical protein